MMSRIPGIALALGLLLCCLPGCPGEQTINQISEHITINPVIPGGTFIGYSGTTFSQSIPSNKKVSLLSATVTSSSGEFSWVDSLIGSSGQTEGSQVIIDKTSFAGDSSPTDMTIVDTGDLLPLYPDQDFRIYWTLQFSSDPAQSYPDGVTLTFNYQLQIE
jgi:hypothetical protein